MIKVDDFHLICRLCMTTGELHPLSDLSALIFLKNTLQIDINDEKLPSNICNQCKSTVDNIQCFIDNCHQCNIILKKITNQSNTVGIISSTANGIKTITNTLIDKNGDCNFLESPTNRESSTNLLLQTDEVLNETKVDDDGTYTLEIKCKFKCLLCGEQCSSKRSLACHLKSHTKEKIYQCSLCPKRFSFEKYLTKHTRDDHGTKPFICHICQQGFSRKRCLDEHMNVHTGDAPYVCNYCGHRFKAARHFNKHIYLSHNPHIDNIPKSKRKYVEKRVHLNLKCKICSKVFASRSGYANHQLIHTGEKKYLCNICGKQFLANSQLLLHLDRHNTEKSYVCTKCDKEFAKKSSLIKHLGTHTLGKDKEIKIDHSCNDCTKSYKTLNALSKHVETHTLNLQCNYCDKMFDNKLILDKHIKQHLSTVKCEVCNKKFSYDSHLKVHMRIHSSEKPFMCSICGKLFSQKQVLTVHIRKHLDITPFKCDRCDKVYYDSTNLKRHIKRNHENNVLVKKTLIC